MTKHVARWVAAAFLAAATIVLLPSAPAQAAVCPGATGVTVVVDFHQLGGGVKTGCAAAGGGKSGSVNFPAAGFPLTYAQRSPGFVCRVSAKPVDDPCINTPPVTAYWSLWWSDGKTGKWSYSSLGVGGLKVPTGGYLAFSWQGQATKAAPGQDPTKRATGCGPVGTFGTVQVALQVPVETCQGAREDRSAHDGAHARREITN